MVTSEFGAAVREDDHFIGAEDGKGACDLAGERRAKIVGLSTNQTSECLRKYKENNDILCDYAAGKCDTDGPISTLCGFEDCSRL